MDEARRVTSNIAKLPRPACSSPTTSVTSAVGIRRAVAQSFLRPALKRPLVTQSGHTRHSGGWCPCQSGELAAIGVESVVNAAVDFFTRFAVAISTARGNG